MKFNIAGIDLFNPIENKLDKIIEYFVKFYGEEYRERIENRLKNTIYIFIGEINKTSLKSTAGEINTYYNRKIKDIETNFFRKHKITEEKYFSISSVDFNEIISVILNYHKNEIEINDIDLSVAKNISELAVAFDVIASIDPKTNEQIYKNVKAVLNNNFYDFYKKLIIFKNYWNSECKSEVEKINSRKTKMVNYFLNLEKASVDVIKDYNNNKVNLLAYNIAKIKNISIEELKKCKKIKLYIYVYLDMFEKEEELLTNFDKQARIDFFKFLGFDFGNDYEKYVKSKTLMKKLFNKNLLSTYDELKDLFYFAQSHINPYYNEEIKKVINTGVYDFDLSEEMLDLITNYSDKLACCYPRIDKNGELINFCICSEYLNLDTATLIHEMNHIVQTDIIKKNEKVYGTKIGLRFLSENNTSKNYDILDEIFNDYISIKIYNTMKFDGFEIGYKPYLVSSYSCAFDLLGNFIDKYQDVLITCSMNDDPILLTKIIGKKNLENLNEVATAYCSLGSREINRCIKELKYSERPEENVKLTGNATIVKTCREIVSVIDKDLEKRLKNFRKTDKLKNKDKNTEKCEQEIDFIK